MTLIGKIKHSMKRIPVTFSIPCEQAICLQKLFLSLQTPLSHYAKDQRLSNHVVRRGSYKEVKLDTSGSNSPP